MGRVDIHSQLRKSKVGKGTPNESKAESIGMNKVNCCDSSLMLNLASPIEVRNILTGSRCLAAVTDIDSSGASALI